MLVRPGGTAEPGVVRDVDQEVRAGAPVLARQVLEGRFVTDEDPEPADARPIDGQIASPGESAGPAAEARQAAEQPDGEERHPLDDGNEVVLAVHGRRAPAPRGVVEERRVVGVVRSAGMPGGINAAREDRGPAVPSERRELRVPGGLLREPTWNRRFGPDEQIEVGARERAARHPDELCNHAVRVRRVPFFAEAFIRLNQPNRADLAQRQRPGAPLSVTEGEQHRRRHHRDAPHTRAPRAAWDARFRQHHIAPCHPQRHAPRAGEISPLHERGCVRERGPKAKPWKPDVALVADDPLQSGPGDGEHHPERRRWHLHARPHHEPEQRRMPQAEDADGRQVPEGGQRGEVPQGDDQPVQDQAL